MNVYEVPYLPVYKTFLFIGRTPKVKIFFKDKT